MIIFSTVRIVHSVYWHEFITDLWGINLHVYNRKANLTGKRKRYYFKLFKVIRAL